LELFTGVINFQKHIYRNPVMEFTETSDATTQSHLERVSSLKVQMTSLQKLRATLAAVLLAIASAVSFAIPAHAYTLTCGTYGSTPSFNCVSNTGFTGQQPWGYPVDTYGHNCTNYASYRLWQNGVAKPSNLGDAMNWDNNAAVYKIPVDNTPAIGSIAVWEANHFPAKYTGHVAYVEAVTSSYIDISEDNYAGTTMRARYYAGEAAWPDHFIHFSGNNSSANSTAKTILTSDGHVQIFKISNGTLRENWYGSADGSNGVWTQTTAPPVQIGGTPAVIQRAGQNVVDVFVRGANNQVYATWYNYQTGGWGGWVGMGGGPLGFTSDPQVHATSDGHVQVFGTGGGAAVQNWYDPNLGTYGGWRVL
jgi:surface antigen